MKRLGIAGPRHRGDGEFRTPNQIGGFEALADLRVDRGDLRVRTPTNLTAPISG
jgi:hypothetical protein